jgi:hypothetical protein
LNTAQCQKLTDRQKDDLLALLRDRYSTVYVSESDLPDNAQVRDSAGRWMGFNGGFSFEFSIVSQGPFWVRVSRSDLEGNLAASFGEHVYVWILGTWVRLHDGPQAVS